MLEDAFARARELPEGEQDVLAETLFAHIAGRELSYTLSEAQAQEVAHRRDALRDGRSRLADDEEVAAFWRRFEA